MFSQGVEAMSQGSGHISPVLFLDPAACEDILADLRDVDGLLPSFSDSDPGSPPPLGESEVTHHTRTTQTPTVRLGDRSTSALLPLSFDQGTSALPHVSTLDQATQVASRPHRATSASQTAVPLSSNQATQVLILPPRSWAYTQTCRPRMIARPTQVPRLVTLDAGTEMPPVTSSSQATQAGCHFDTDMIPPGAATPPPQVSDNEEADRAMDLGEENALLASSGRQHHDSDDDDGFVHV